MLHTKGQFFFVTQKQYVHGILGCAATSLQLLFKSGDKEIWLGKQHVSSWQLKEVQVIGFTTHIQNSWCAPCLFALLPIGGCNFDVCSTKCGGAESKQIPWFLTGTSTDKTTDRMHINWNIFL